MKRPTTKPTKEAVMLESFTTRLPAGLLREMKMRAAQTGESVQEITANAIALYLKAHKREVN